MSTLTKVLIVLLSVFSLFLCGVVVTYVANAENYRQTATDQRRDVQIAKNRQQDAEDELAAHKETSELMKQELEAQISAMTIKADRLQGQLVELDRKNAELVQRVANSSDAVKVTSETQQKMLAQAQADQARVADLLAEQTRLETQLKETNQLLLDKMGIIDTLQARNNQLVQANHDLEARANQYLQQYGRATPAPQPVTPLPGVAQPAERPTQEIDLDGRIIRVDLPLAEISIGEAAGVRPNMKFHVTRGDQFVCYLEILDVDPDTAVGVLTVMQSEPRAGDAIKTNL